MKYKKVFSVILLLSGKSLADVAIDSITVTASRHDETNKSASITTLENMLDMHTAHISEVLNQAPAVWITRGNGQEHLTAIRSPVLVGSGGCGAFLMAEDNIPLRAAGFCNANQLFDANYEQADNIEILRGPGSVFYGSNAMHGIINIISPDFSDNKKTTITGEYENSHDYGKVLVDHREKNWLVQANAAEDNGYKENSGFKQQKLRIKYLQQGEKWTLTHNINAMNLEQDTAGFVNGKNAYKDDDRKKENNDPDAYRNAHSLRLYSKFNFQPDDNSEFIFTPYIRSNDMRFLMHFIRNTPIEENGHDSIGFQSAFFRPYNNDIVLITGFDADYTKGYLTQFQKKTDPTAPVKFPAGAQYNFDVSLMTTAVFLQTNITLQKDWLLTLGTRLENARYNYRNNLTDSLPTETSRYVRSADAILGFYNWSPKATLSYDFADNHTAYTNLSKAFRAPEANELFRLEDKQVVANIDSEEIESAELGFKGNISQIMHYDVSVFTMNKDNVIIKDSARHNVDNQKTSHKGIEASFNFNLTKTVFLSTQLSYAKHEYDTNILNPDGTVNKIKGNIIDTAPRHIHHLAITWLPTEKSEVVLDNVYLSSYYLDPENHYSYPGHTLTNLRLKQVFAGQWEAGFGITNLFDTDYADRADLTTIAPIVERYFIGEPRSYRFSVSKTF